MEKEAVDSLKQYSMDGDYDFSDNLDTADIKINQNSWRLLSNNNQAFVS